MRGKGGVWIAGFCIGLFLVSHKEGEIMQARGLQMRACMKEALLRRGSAILFPAVAGAKCKSPRRAAAWEKIMRRVRSSHNYLLFPFHPIRFMLDADHGGHKDKCKCKLQVKLLEVQHHHQHQHQHHLLMYVLSCNLHAGPGQPCRPHCACCAGAQHSQVSSRVSSCPTLAPIRPRTLLATLLRIVQQSTIPFLSSCPS